jgi:hypothetical protein
MGCTIFSCCFAHSQLQNALAVTDWLQPAAHQSSYLPSPLIWAVHDLGGVTDVFASSSSPASSGLKLVVTEEKFGLCVRLRRRGSGISVVPGKG